MSTPFLSEIKLVSFNFAPKGWAECNGQLLPINQNQALFSLLGTTYGGNGQTNFALPNLKGEVPIHVGNGFTLGQTGGTETVTINAQTMPSHNHTLSGTNNAAAGDDATNSIYAQAGGNTYAAYSSPTPMGAQAIGNTGGSQPHTNLMPFLVLNFVIALQGIFPSPN